MMLPAHPPGPTRPFPTCPSLMLDSQVSLGALVTSDSAWTGPLRTSSSTIEYTSRCLFRLVSPSNFSLVTSMMKCVSPVPGATPILPAWPACLPDSSTMFNSAGANSSVSFCRMESATGVLDSRVSSSATAPSSAAAARGASSRRPSAFLAPPTIISRLFACITLNIDRNPFERLGVRLWPRPSLVIKSSGCTEMICSAVHPERPLTRRAARPLVSCESESACQVMVPSSFRVG
mmetsp:Transcript_14537/g.41400  ORF Transcript_14537/g.41400 Transcript_14537/m.41400 type:complete len:234 (+) Transcript_14537:89-790(+)